MAAQLRVERRSGMRSLLGVVALGMVILAAGGCGSASTGEGGANHAAGSPTASATSSLAAVAVCRTDQLSLSMGQSGAALGHVAVEHRFTNGSAQACSLTGYPQIQLVDANHTAMAVPVQQSTGAYTFTGQQVQTVVLSPGASAYFKLEWTDVPPSSGSCPRASYLRATAPGAASAIELAESIQPCASVITSPVEPNSF